MTIGPVIADYYTVLTMSVNELKANGITSHYSGQPRFRCLNVPHRRRTKKCTLFFNKNFLRFKSKALYSVK